MPYNTRYRSFNTSGYLPTGVKWLLISNVAIFLLFAAWITRRIGRALRRLFRPQAGMAGS